MGAGVIVTLALVLLVITLVTGFPIGFAIIISSCVALLLQSLPFSMGTIKMVNGVDSFLLTAIPFFVFAGILMREAGITRRILHF